MKTLIDRMYRLSFNAAIIRSDALIQPSGLKHSTAAWTLRSVSRDAEIKCFTLQNWNDRIFRWATLPY